MDNNQVDKLIQSPDNKSNEPLTEDSVSIPGKSIDNVQDTDEGKTEAAFQRKPQFRLSENGKKRY